MRLKALARKVIKRENGAENTGNPVFWYRGQVLAWEADPPHVRVYAWCSVNLFPGRPLSVDIEPVGRLLKLSPREVRKALAKLTVEGDLIRSGEGKRALYRLNIEYPEEEPSFGGIEARLPIPVSK